MSFLFRLFLQSSNVLSTVNVVYKWSSNVSTSYTGSAPSLLDPSSCTSASQHVHTTSQISRPTSRSNTRSSSLIGRRPAKHFRYSVINSLWPSDAIWRHRSWSTLAQVMACCLTAPSHYLNQCWHIISKVQWHSFEVSSTRYSPSINQ